LTDLSERPVADALILLPDAMVGKGKGRAADAFEAIQTCISPDPRFAQA
jgi:hypothetical protein